MMPEDPRFDGPGPDARWQAALSEGVFTIQHCDACGAAQFPPAVTCRACHGGALSMVSASGKGAVYSTTTVRSREGAHNVSIIELAEGPRMMASVEGDPEAVRIGQAVTARVAPGEPPMVVFAAEGAE
ncbi:Zn-ribbon domain-containing OB-fold protein [Pelagivirga sediminicola]|nr:OB-fold domain-containing protein [Pelagivirga sediminicola]